MAHTHWRIRWIDNGSSLTICAIAEVEMRTAAGGADVTDPANAIAGAVYGANTADRAFDDDPATIWTSYAAGVNSWVGQAFPAAQDVVEIAMTSANGAWSSNAPTAFEVEASDDGVTWVGVASVSGEASWTRAEERVFTVAAADPGVTASPGAGSVGVAGFAPTVSVGATAFPGVGGVGVAGLAPGVSAGQTAAPGVGAVGVAGLAPLVSVGASAAPGPGAVDVVGRPPGTDPPPVIALEISARPGARVALAGSPCARVQLSAAPAPVVAITGGAE